MILRRMEEGAAKWALRDLRREEETSGEKGQQSQNGRSSTQIVIQKSQKPSSPNFIENPSNHSETERRFILDA